MILNLQLLVIHWLLFSQTTPCPRHCSCNVWKTVECTGKSITDITAIPKDTKRLMIKRTNITWFSSDTYNLPKLIDLSLKSNQHLEYVIVSKNLHSLRSLQLNGNTKLQSHNINIDSNSIVVFDLNDNNLKHMISNITSPNRIEHLIIRGNQIELFNLSDSTFPLLSFLALDSNPLKELQIISRTL